ncbi:hypothetical protein BOTBODRAFT_170874 [Botryobasidium botryosum FD-172 SS1]|uniref:Uncharacterized protein n=1 Tax=Botryobasidium botryosum (strain FD-172 SS1) TaxID=930990 RepID=A0A067N565_BOTB1|nr:hypothetical protein BOTBODRAFT_170874 [Botryobasidium botryosum FD-172 SS1]
MSSSAEGSPIVPPPSAHVKSAYTTFSSYQPPQPGDFIKLHIPDSAGILLRTPSKSKTTPSLVRSYKSRSRSKLQWVIVATSTPIAREDGAIEAYALTVYPVVSFDSPSEYDQLPLSDKLKYIPIPPGDPLRSSPAYTLPLRMGGFVNSSLSCLHVDTQDLTYSVNNKLRHYTPHVRLSSEEMDDIASFVCRLAIWISGPPTSNAVGSIGGGTGGAQQDNQASGGGRLSSSNLFTIACDDMPLGGTQSSLDPPSTIHAWAGGAGSPGDTTTPPPFDHDSADYDLAPQPSSGPASDVSADSSDTDSDGFDDPNSEEFMAMFSPERYVKFMQQKEAQELLAEQLRMNSIAAWRAGVQRSVTDNSTW